jgi:hypothetical protein
MDGGIRGFFERRRDSVVKYLKSRRKTNPEPDLEAAAATTTAAGTTAADTTARTSIPLTNLDGAREAVADIRAGDATVSTEAAKATAETAAVTSLEVQVDNPTRT